MDKKKSRKKCIKNVRLRVWTRTHAKVTYTHFNIPITHTHINEFVHYYIISFLWAICLKQFKTSKDHFSKLSNVIPTLFQWILLGQEDQSSVEAPPPPSQQQSQTPVRCSPSNPPTSLPRRSCRTSNLFCLHWALHT